MKLKLLFVSLIVVLLVSSSLCVQKDLRSITINGQTYPFDYNLFKIIEINATNTKEIKSLIDEYPKICLEFNESSQDKKYFAVGGFNLVFRITRLYILEGIKKNVTVCNEEPKIVFLGPNTGAKETSVSLVNNTIIVQGTTPDNFEMAVDRLSLIVLGVDKERLEEEWALKK